MKVYQRMARAFRAEGITHTFGIMGDGNMYWLNEMIKLGATDVEVRHEGAGLGMADGWSRATRQPSCATATCGPGVSQLATALITASRRRASDQ
jgi:thiamine pyrophosphate-dependent acetolactate synthase large subunit-like protein